MVFSMNRFSYEMAQNWVLQYDLTYPVLFDPPPSAAYYSYAHLILPQNTLTDRNFEVIYDHSAGYQEDAIIQAIEANLYPVAVLLRSSSDQVVAGEDLIFDVTLRNWGESTQSFSAWIDVILPGHRRLPTNPQLGPGAVSLEPGEVLTQTFRMEVPRFTPAADNYRLKVSIGSLAEDDIFNCDLLEIDVVK